MRSEEAAVIWAVVVTASYFLYNYVLEPKYFGFVARIIGWGAG